MWKRIQRLSLNTMTLQITSEHVNTKQGVPISCIGVAQVKIESRNEKMLRQGTIYLLDELVKPFIISLHPFSWKIWKCNSKYRPWNNGRSSTRYHGTNDCRRNWMKWLLFYVNYRSNHLWCTYFQFQKEIVKERKAFGIKVFEVASTDLMNMGIQVVSYTLKDIRDRNGYLKALGQGRAAQVKRWVTCQLPNMTFLFRNARIGEATAKKNSSIKEAEAEEQRMKSK